MIALSGHHSSVKIVPEASADSEKWPCSGLLQANHVDLFADP
uniref:Uncharacterized protein n=1 Tax=Pseudomonas aeruginosa TaxID=287 RepID=A0A5P9WC77_PSEAI|nr:hypothetical protein pNK546KPC_0597 [Pseudomonas aeruginosa]QLG05296.1 hypothetical protein [Pseudomonas aeruginosa]